MLHVQVYPPPPHTRHEVLWTTRSRRLRYSPRIRENDVLNVHFHEELVITVQYSSYIIIF
jgi:hypothetical protein